jgi:hypothetical protein
MQTDAQHAAKTIRTIISCLLSIVSLHHSLYFDCLKIAHLTALPVLVNMATMVDGFQVMYAVDH